MKIISLVENTSFGSAKAVHGLSFYIETRKHKILFDLGPDKTLFENAKRKKIDLSAVDTVIISHGHVDHGGALKRFLELNKTAKIYVQRRAYEPHYTKALFFKIYIGLDKDTMKNENIVLLDGDYVIDSELSLFVSKTEDKIKSEANKALLAGNEPDNFKHEQNLLIKENKTVLLTGCAHSGVIAILESMGGAHPDCCIGGFHVYNPVSRKTVPDFQLKELSAALEKYGDIRFYTCHCTGKKAFDFLSQRHGNIEYFACGNTKEF